MFRSQFRPINLPQYEHAKFAGTLAAHWGNDDFPRPPIDFAGFVQGVTLHDWNYRLIDNFPILGMNDADRLALFRKGIDYHFADPTTDIVVQLHLRRLLRWWGAEVVQPLIAEIDERVAARVMETPNTLDQFHHADTITNLCDVIPFHFAFEVERERQVEVYAGAGKTKTVTFWVAPNEPIIVDPWPFAVPALSGILIAYEREGYPDRLAPLVFPYTVQPR